MLTIPVRRMLGFSPEDFERRLKSTVKVEYEDGVIVRHTSREMTVNRYLYTIMELIPESPILSTYSIHNYYVSGHYVGKSLNKAMEAMLKGYCNLSDPSIVSRVVIEDLYERMYMVFENVYNYIICNHLEYVASLDIRDFLEIQNEKVLLDAISAVRVDKTKESVAEAYVVLDNLICSDYRHSNNPIAKGYISGTIARDQVKQLLGPRGFVTDINGAIYKYPIASSFVLGLSDIYEMAAESRSGAKAIYMSTKAIQTSEYFAREMQLGTMHIESLVDGDCGNKEFLEWRVSEDDLPNLNGKHYFDNGVERVVSVDDTALIGELIHLRSVNRCKVPNKRHICTACFGKMYINVPRHFNLGHVAVTTPTADFSQKLLSTKHLTFSASSETIHTDGAMKEFFITKANDPRGVFAFRANALNKKKTVYRLHVPQDQGRGIKDLVGSDVSKVNLVRISSLSTIYISIEDNAGTRTETLPIKQGSRCGALSVPFLEYVQKYGYTIDEYDRLTIDLSGWMPGVPIIAMPQVEFNYLDMVKLVKGLFRGIDSTVETPEAMVHKLYNMINNKLTINIALLEVIVAAFTVEDPNHGKYGLGRGTDVAVPVRTADLLTKRSLGGALAWESVKSTLGSAYGYYGRNNVNHPLDVLLKPNEVLLKERGKL